MPLAPLRACLLSLILLAAACSETSVPADKAKDMQAEKAFQDPKTAELADAAAHGDAARVRELVKAGANPNAQGERGVNLLQYALIAKSADGLQALLDNGADPNHPGLAGSTVVHAAAIADDPDYLRRLLDKGADPNVRHRISGAPPLSGAAGPRTDAQFRMLLERGAKPDLADNGGNTPLHIAAMINAGQHVLLLLERGANPNARNAQNATFQTYFFKTPAASLTAEAKQNREAVVAWLRAHQIPLEAGAG